MKEGKIVGLKFSLLQCLKHIANLWSKNLRSANQWLLFIILMLSVFIFYYWQLFCTSCASICDGLCLTQSKTFKKMILIFFPCFCSSMTSLILSSSHPQPLHWLLPCSWTTLLITRIAPKIEECHGGPSLEHSKEIAGMKSSTPSLSTSTAFFLHLKQVVIKKDDRGKASFPY